MMICLFKSGDMHKVQQASLISIPVRHSQGVYAMCMRTWRARRLLIAATVEAYCLRLLLVAIATMPSCCRGPSHGSGSRPMTSEHCTLRLSWAAEAEAAWMQKTSAAGSM